jgi:hypothetical protein
MKRIITLTIILITVASSLAAVSFEPFVETEQGTIAVLSHTYKNGDSSTTDPADMDLFDFRNEGGQDRLFPFERYSIGATIAERHRAWFTYQPFELITDVRFQEEKTIGNTTFAENTPMELTYSFPFYRFSYTYDVLGKHDHAILGLGMVVQIRNVSIQFKSLAAAYDGTAQDDLYVSNNVGVVPALAIYSAYRFPFGLTLSADIAGSAVDSAFFNGADFTFAGSILDASLSMAYQVGEQWELFGTARFFGGTSDGTSQYPVDTWTEGDADHRYSQNNIATVTATVGVRWTH